MVIPGFTVWLIYSTWIRNSDLISIEFLNIIPGANVTNQIIPTPKSIVCLLDSLHRDFNSFQDIIYIV